MKKALTFLLVFCTIGSFAQERKVIRINNVINTVKERLTITGFLQAGYDYEDGADGQNSFNLKRADMALTAKITEHWKAMFAYAFANGSVQELWTEYEFIPQLRLKAGQFKITFGLENGITPTKAELIDDYSQVTCYMLGVRGNPLQGNHAGRDIGIVLNGDLFNNLLHYDLALMNGQGINRKDGNKNKDLGMKQTNYIAGADWWFYPGCRLRLNYTRQERSAAMGNDSNWLQAQIQVGF